jgi:hypothetical protein
MIRETTKKRSERRREGAEGDRDIETRTRESAASATDWRM